MTNVWWNEEGQREIQAQKYHKAILDQIRLFLRSIIAQSRSEVQISAGFGNRDSHDCF